jgi:hypothetical protein
MTYDLESFEFGTLTIDGLVRIEGPFQTINLTAVNIWIRAGSLIVGTKDVPYNLSKINIILKGTRNSTNLLIDDLSDSGTKTLAVTGRMEIYAPPVATTWTRLIQKAKIGDTSITVASTDGWAVGDEIILAPTEFNSTGTEKFKITSIAAGGVIGIDSAIKFFHYGSTLPTAAASGGLNNIGSKFSGYKTIKYIFC